MSLEEELSHLKFLIEFGEEENVKLQIEEIHETYGKFPIHCFVDEDETIYKLLDKYKKHISLDSVNKEGYTALSLACKTGNKSSFFMLSAKGAKPFSDQYNNSNVLKIALENDRKEFVEYIRNVVK